MTNQEQRSATKIDLSVWGWFGIGFFLILIVFGIYSGRQGEGMLAFLATRTTTPTSNYSENDHQMDLVFECIDSFDYLICIHAFMLDNRWILL